MKRNILFLSWRKGEKIRTREKREARKKKKKKKKKKITGMEFEYGYGYVYGSMEVSFWSRKFRYIV